MNIKYNIDRLKKIITDYANVSGLSIGVLDTDFNYIVTYAPKSHNFCLKIQETEYGQKKCLCSDIALLKKCRKNRCFVSHICHAGITDAAYPIIKNDIILGYIMLGRMRTNHSFSDIKHHLATDKFNFNELSLYYDHLDFFENNRVQSIANIAAIIVAYILTDNIIKPEYNNILKNIIEYINENISSDLSVTTLCKKMNISKNLLYKNFHITLNCTVNEYICNQRINYAKNLLKTTDLSISEISESIGIKDCTYFCRLFKKKNGVSPAIYRKLHNS